MVKEENTVYFCLNTPRGRYISQKICKKTSYYFVNFCLEKNNFWGQKGDGGRLLEEGVKSGVYVKYKPFIINKKIKVESWLP